MRFRLRAFYQPFALIFTHCNGVFPGKGTIYLSEGTLGKKEGFLFSREAFLFSNGASIFRVKKVQKVHGTFLTPKLTVGPRVCVLLYGSRVGEFPYEILAEPLSSTSTAVNLKSGADKYFMP